MKISQETYDETLLENEEIFELSPSDAIKETISQFNQQGITDLDSYIVTTHPSSNKGKEERLVRSKFTSLLNKLDSFIGSDGKINIDNDLVVETIESVHEYLRNGKCANDEKNEEEEKNENDTTLPSKSGDPVPFLTMAHSSSSLYTFMNLLSIIEFPTNYQHNKLPLPTKNQTSILHASLKLLVTVLCPRNKNEKDTKMLFKDLFICYGRLVGLILYHTNLVQQLQKDKSTDASLALLNDYIETIRLLIKCTMNACKNCEKNKVLFVRCLRATRITDSLESLIDDFHRLELLENGGINDANASERVITKKERESTIGIVSNLVRFTLALYQASLVPSKLDDDKGDGKTNNVVIIQKNSVLELMTECCKLISVLCRFDDFRTADATVDSSYGGVSSAHDHVLEFNREGIIPSLHELILLSLDQKSENNDCNDEMYEGRGVALAAAALSATRVLAVNDEIVQALVAVGVLKTIKVVLDMGVVGTVEDEGTSKNKINESENDQAKTEGKDGEDEMEETNEEDEEQAEDVQNDQQSSQEKILLSQKQQLTTGAIGLIRNLCGNDEIKTTLCVGSSSSSGQSGNSTIIVPSVLPSIVEGMSMYKNVASIQEHGCGALAAMALRKPTNALRIIHENGASSILTAMKLFPRNVLVQRQGALAIRNIVSRLVANPSAAVEEGAGGTVGVDSSASSSSGDSNNVRDIFLDLGAEVILRGITGRHQGSVDEAYAALRDLGCAVSMVKYDAETQSATTRTVMFGDVKPKFRPVYEES